MRVHFYFLLVAILAFTDGAERKQRQKGGGLFGGIAFIPRAAKAAVTCVKMNGMLKEAFQTLREEGVLPFLLNPGRETKVDEDGKCAKSEVFPLVTKAAGLGSLLLGSKNCNKWKTAMEACLDDDYKSYDDECSSSWSLIVCALQGSISAFQSIIDGFGGLNKYVIPMVTKLINSIIPSAIM